MSTILDALRKAQEETGSGREAPVGKVPVSGEPGAPRRQRPRRALTWLATAVAILAVAFVGGLALGNRLTDLFGGAGEQAAPVAREAAAPEIPASGPADAPAPAKNERVQAEPKTEPLAVANAQRALPGGGADAARPAAPAAKAQVAAASARAVAEPMPTPYGQLHVFGAAEQPSRPKADGEDRAARLQELRERMLKARREAKEGAAGRSAAAPVPIVVPPPRDRAEPRPAAPQAAVEPAPAVAPAPAAEPVPAVASVPAAAAAAAGDVAAEVEAQQVLAAAAAEAAAAAPAPPPAAVAAAARPARPASAIGVSVGNEHGEPIDGEIRDPDIAAQKDDDARPRQAEPAPAAVASLPAPAPAALAAPPVLRRSPGGAPQVSINILQWSAEPGRRFAFVSVDGGGMTQVREGDRIGGLTVKHIHQQMIEFGFNDSSFLLRAN